ncbi:MAG: ParA family protein [bacterium]|nr:ParA family protein [bacterium]
MCKVISIANQKGGVGKTTTTVNLGKGLSDMGKKVLLIDFDAQGSLTESLGYSNPDEIPSTISDLMQNVIEDRPLNFKSCVLHNDEGIDIIPANIELSGMETILVNIMSRERVLKELISQLTDSYDYILIDCTPSLGMLTINALVASDEVIIPVQAHFLPAKGLEHLMRTISKVKRQINPGLKIGGILLTMVDRRTNFAKSISELIRNTYGNDLRVFQSEIPLSIRAAETSAAGKSIYGYDKRCSIANAYTKFTEELCMEVG